MPTPNDDWTSRLGQWLWMMVAPGLGFSGLAAWFLLQSQVSEAFVSIAILAGLPRSLAS